MYEKEKNKLFISGFLLPAFQRTKDFVLTAEFQFQQELRDALSEWVREWVIGCLPYHGRNYKSYRAI